MLVLSRKKNESVIINDDIQVIVVEIRGDKVRLGIEAPKEIPVNFLEVFDAICRGSHNRAADIHYEIDRLRNRICDLEAELSNLTACEPET